MTTISNVTMDALDLTIKKASMEVFGEEIKEDDIVVLEMDKVGSIFTRVSTKQSFLFVSCPQLSTKGIEVRVCTIK
jgi:hypothetical protein